MTIERTPPHKKAKQLAKYLRQERPDYNYLKKIFQSLRQELDVTVEAAPKQLPYVPTEEDLTRYYDVVWNIQNFQDLLIIKTLLYTGVRVSELVNIKLLDVDFSLCQIRIIDGKGGKDRRVPFPVSFRELLGMHAEKMKKIGAKHLFESFRKKKYTDRAIRKILEKYSHKAGLTQNISPHKMRHFLLTWLKRQGIDDALIQPYSGHESRKSLEIYSRLSITEAQKQYDKVIAQFPV